MLSLSVVHCPLTFNTPVISRLQIHIPKSSSPNRVLITMLTVVKPIANYSTLFKSSLGAAKELNQEPLSFVETVRYRMF